MWDVQNPGKKWEKLPIQQVSRISSINIIAQCTPTQSLT